MNFKVQTKKPGYKVNKLKILIKKTFCTLNSKRKEVLNKIAPLNDHFNLADALLSVIENYNKVIETV